MNTECPIAIELLSIEFDYKYVSTKIILREMRSGNGRSKMNKKRNVIVAYLNG